MNTEEYQGKSVQSYRRLLYQGEAMEIECKYIVDERNRRVAVQLDIETFEKIEETLENHGLIRLMQEEEQDDEILELEQARAYYRTLEKAK